MCFHRCFCPSRHHKRQTLQMGELTTNRKRSGEVLKMKHFPPSCNFHKPKKPKFSSTDQSSKLSDPSSKRASRLSRYPACITKISRGIHAPRTILKYGLLKSVSFDSRSETRKKRKFVEVKKRKFVEVSDSMTNNILCNSYNTVKKASGGLRHSAKDKEVIDLDSVVEEIEVVEVMDKDNQERSTVIDVVGADVNGGIVEKPLAVTNISNEDVNVDNRVSMDSMYLDGESIDVCNLEMYIKACRKLYKKTERTQRRNSKLQIFDEIQLTEKRQTSLQRPWPVIKSVEEVTRHLFIPLTNVEEEQVEHAFSANGRKVLVSHEKSNIKITAQNFQCLRPRKWLNDEVINIYFELLKERESREPERFLRCHFFNTFFYKKLISGRAGYDFRAIKRWTSARKLGYSLLECDKIFVPIHKEIHWCLAIINKKDQKFQYLDSLGGRDGNVLRQLAKYFVEEVKDKSGQDIDVSSWEHECSKGLPEQQNGYDCGMFMIKYADFYSRGLGLCFNQEHMTYFRQRTAKEILNMRAE